MRRIMQAFTLAEVLIVITIIGVVAAMTMPTLMSNIKGKRFYSQYKKSLSTLINAVRLNKAKFDFDFGELEMVCQYYNYHANFDNPTKEMSACSIFNTNLSGASFLDVDLAYRDTGHYFPSAIGSDSSVFLSYKLSDGSIFYFSNWLGRSKSNPCRIELGQTLNKSFIESHSECLAWIDVNGEQGPNEIVQCSDNVATDYTPNAPCIVKNKDITDIFPVFLHDLVVEPATNASAGVFLKVNSKNAEMKMKKL